MGLLEIWQNALALFAESKFSCLLIWSLSQHGDSPHTMPFLFYSVLTPMYAVLCYYYHYIIM
jgi:RsiW-degrading membrane proteinase PrsW (M82 family)